MSAPETSAALEAARQKDGKFGTQPHAAPTRPLADSLAPLMDAEGDHAMAALPQDARDTLGGQIERARAELLGLQYKVDSANLAAAIKNIYPDATFASFTISDERIRSASILGADGEHVAVPSGWDNDPAFVIGSNVSWAVQADIYDNTDYDEYVSGIDLTADEPALDAFEDVCQSCGRRTDENFECKMGPGYH